MLAVFQKPIWNLLLFLLFFFLLSIFHELILGKEKAITHLLPFILIVATVITMLPSSEQRIPWERITEPTAEFFGRTTRRISDFLPWGESTEFGVNFIGYTEDGRLGGEVRHSEGEALRLTGQCPHSSLYLTGTIMDTYTGAGWERRQNMEHFYYDEIMLETLELLLALYAHDMLYSPEHLSLDEDEWIAQWLEVGVLNIEFLDIRTRSIFHPLRTLSLTSNSRMNLAGSDLFFTRPQESGTSYTLHHLSLNYRQVNIQELLMSASQNQGISYRVLEGINADEFFNYFVIIPGFSIPRFPIPDQAIEILEQRRELIYYYYTTLPETIPERVALLAKEITRDYPSNYEKMRAIERFFTTNHFTYTITPPPIPEGDFVDWFIFEGTEGYCTYFATAAAILGRSVGIPVRYVQGFAIPISEEEEIIVRNRYAHAWIEAYIHYVGWIPFEPTPTFGELRRGTWGDRGVLDGTADQIVERESPDFHYRRESNLEPQEDIIEVVEEERVYLPAVIAALIILLVIVLGIFLSWYIYFIKGKRKFQNLSTDIRFKWLLKEVLYLLELQGYSIKLGETLKEFSHRLMDKECGKVVALHEKVIYEKKSISLEELEVAGKYRDDLVKGLEKKHLKMQYWLYISMR